ncbi:MAG TPA: transposase [Ktedonobacteraceae bacterium]
MSLDDFIITCFCVIDELVPEITKGKRLRTRGAEPKLTDSEVITMEVVGSYLGMAQDKELFLYFQRHYTHFFPALHRLSRSTFVRQAANLWAVKEHLWCWLRDEVISYDPTLSMIDSVPLPVCRFARAPWCVRFRGQASSGKDHADRHTFYGFRLHAQLSWPGLLTRLFLAPANEADGEIVPVVLEGATGVVLGDRNYWLPDVQACLREPRHPVASSVSSCPLAQDSGLPECCAGACALSHRYRLRSIDGSLSDQARLGAGSVAFA